MKKFFLFVAGLAFLSAIIGCVLGANAKNIFLGGSVKGSGKIVTRTMTVGSFDAIEASRGVQVLVADMPDDGIRIDADDNVADLVRVCVKDRTLHVGIDKSVNSLSDIHVTVAVPYDARIGKLKASSTASIVCKKPLSARKVALKASSSGQMEAVVDASECEIDASSAARIDADVTASECEVDASSAARIELKGSADRCDAELSSAAELSAGKFTVAKYDIHTSSGASADIRCAGQLEAGASSGSSIRYAGDCQADSDVSSGGSIRKN